VGLKNLFCVDTSNVVKHFEYSNNIFSEKSDFELKSPVVAVDAMSPDEHSCWIATATADKMLNVWSKE